MAEPYRRPDDDWFVLTHKEGLVPFSEIEQRDPGYASTTQRYDEKQPRTAAEARGLKEDSYLVSAIAEANDPDLVIDFIDLLRATGIDPTDPRITPILQVVQQMDEQTDDPLTAQKMMQLQVQVAQQEVFGSSSWGSALIASGFAAYDLMMEQEVQAGSFVPFQTKDKQAVGPNYRFGKTDLSDVNALREERGLDTIEGLGGESLHPGGGPPTGIPPYAENVQARPVTAVWEQGSKVSGPYQRHPTSGWWRYETGVMVDPSSGQVLYNPTQNAPGSLTWATQASRTWSPEKVNEWRKKLVNLGYMEEAQKKGPWDIQFESALMEYYNQLYLHQGQEMRLTNDEGKGGLDFNLRNIAPAVRNSVREQFIRTFGDLPTEAELEYWEDFVIKTGNRLQRRKSMTPEQAGSIAEERMIEKVMYSPQAMYINEMEEENTELRDAMNQAIAATMRLSS